MLSWSLLEAMASGCLIVGSDTAPVREVLRHGGNALLTDGLNCAAITRDLLQALTQLQRFAPLRQIACKDARRYSLEQGAKGYLGAMGLSDCVGLCGVIDWAPSSYQSLTGTQI